jgi:hypothetical protein
MKVLSLPRRIQKDVSFLSLELWSSSVSEVHSQICAFSFKKTFVAFLWPIFTLVVCSIEVMYVSTGTCALISCKQESWLIFKVYTKASSIIVLLKSKVIKAL